MTGLELDWKQDDSDSIADDALGVLVSALELDGCQGGKEWSGLLSRSNGDE